MDISGNTFSKSESFIGTNILTITLESETWGPCGDGVSIASNIFVDIQSSCQVDNGLVRVQCNNTAYAESVKTDDQRRDYTYINQTR